jgi:hypothetical protein
MSKRSTLPSRRRWRRDDLSLELLLEKSRSRKIPLATLREEFARERPELASSGTFRARLRARLDELAAAGRIAFPSESGNAWDTVGQPSLPKWVQRPPTPAPPRVDAAAIAWLPAMAFARKLQRAVDVEAALAINEFLVRRRHDLQPVPLRERSLQIFGDEKALGRRCRAGALFGGQLKLENIGAFDPAPPLPYETIGVPGLPVLLLENHHTYWSFSSWNATSRRYSAVVYGAGWVISRCGDAVATVLRQTGGTAVEYFGDVDPTGIRIALKLSQQLVAAGLPPLRPAADLYRRAFETGIRAPLNRAPSKAQLDEAKGWLPLEQHAHLEALYGSAKRIPQESVGLDALRTWRNP